MAKKKKPKKPSKGDNVAAVDAGVDASVDGWIGSDAAADPPRRAAAAAGGDGEEDLSLRRHDEETVLSAIYGDDFSSTTGAWHCPLYTIRVRSPDDHHDDDDAKRCSMTLSMQLDSRYPHSVPLLRVTDVTGVALASTSRLSTLLSSLRDRATECAASGEVMGWELGRVVEDFVAESLENRREEDRRRMEDMRGGKGRGGGSGSVFLDDYDDDADGGSNARPPAETDPTTTTTTTTMTTVDDDTEREVARQIEALDAAVRARDQRRGAWGGGVLPSIVDKHDDDDDDDEGSNDDVENLLRDRLDRQHSNLGAGGAVNGGSNNNVSRYQTDFVEIAHLGRGGGGEVVRAINRLDRREYAIKKVLLEAEDGTTTTTTAAAASQNEKLMRELYTISMMSHKNIVRYYQAWVERIGGGGGDDDRGEEGEGPADVARDDGNNDDVAGDDERQTGVIDEISSDEERKGDDNDNDNDDYDYDDDGDGDDSSESSNWSTSSGSCSPPSSSSSQSADEGTPIGNEATDEQAATIAKNFSRSISLDNYLENEIGLYDPGNPLLGNAILSFGYPPHTTASSSEKRLPSQSRSTSDWNGSNLNSQRQRRHSKEYGIMYIQMQYCKTTMRGMIDESKLSIDAVWKSLRQILEALEYIHSRNVIHRDLKPANIFIDDEENIRLGDFGLATSNRSTATPGNNANSLPDSEVDALYEAIDDISGLLGSSANLSSNIGVSMNSITGGVGTTLYMAPEQHLRTKSSYSSKADIFSLGVLLFEMFMLRPIGCTYMERAEVLTALRGESRSVSVEEPMNALFNEEGEVIGDWKLASEQRFPENFRVSVPLNAQKIILWCLERSPKRRPSAKQLLSCNLLPRKVELEEKYLHEVLQTLSNPQSEQSYATILSKLFDRPTPNAVLTTFDNEVSIRANKIDARHLLAKSLDAVKGSSWTTHGLSYCNVMSGVAVAAAVTALGRAQQVGTVSGGGKEGEALRGAPQQVATILAMTAASAAAVEGCANGILGADPRVVEGLCRKLSDIFQSHGAVRLQGPLLRPRDANVSVSSLNKPVELLARRGSVLRLREDLCVNFARSVSRGGSSTNNMKRFDINKVFIESEAGLHPKEILEATFDIIQDENIAMSEFLEAETILVLCRVMRLLTPTKDDKMHEVAPTVLKSPIWVLRMTHTRLSDAIMDLMFLPTSEVTRQCCLHIFTALASCPPLELCNLRGQSGKYKRKTREMKQKNMAFLDKALETAIEHDNLPKRSAKRLRAFLSHFLLPQLDANKVLDDISAAARKIHHADLNSLHHNDEVKRLSSNCFREAIRCVDQLRQLLKAMEALGIETAVEPNENETLHNGVQRNLSYPAYISIDLGLRQKRKHYSGRMFFQATLLQNDFFQEDGQTTTNPFLNGRGIRIAEGGRYDDLVRQFRPPGNFGSVQVSHYTAAKVPVCTGLTIFLGKMIERIYHDSSHCEQRHSQSFVESLRRSIGHPMFSFPVKCIVSSEGGLDLATCAERAKIASLLWSAGISCEYLAQSGVLLSLLRHFSSDSNIVHEWSSSVDRICGTCAILNIPYAIIVQPHLLKTKAVVKLRQTAAHSSSGPLYKGTEEIVPLQSLQSLLLERLSSRNNAREDSPLTDIPNHPSSSDLQAQSNNNIDIECIYVGTDQYFDNEHKVNNSQRKQIMKVMKSSTQKMATRIRDFSDQSTPVIAIDLPFRVVRDVGSLLIFDGIEALNGSEVTAKYPTHKKLLRTLMYALDALVRKHQSQRNSEGRRQLTFFLYSISCDNYDLVTLSR